MPALPAPDFDLLSVDPLVMGGGQLPGAAAADPLAGPLANPLAQPAATSSAAGSSNKWLIAAIAGGGGVLVVVILVLVVMSSMGGGDPVAEAPGGTTPSTPPPTPSAMSSPSPTPSPAPSSTSSSATSSGTTTPATSSGPSSSSTTDSGTRTTPASSAPSTPDKSQIGKAKLPPAASGDHSVTALPVAIQTWHGKPGGKLTGIFNAGDTENPVGHISWMAGLLPHLGYQKEYDRLKLDKDINEKPNMEVATVIIKEFQNPLDPRQRWEGYPFGGLALTHFVGMSGIEDARNVVAAQLPRSDPRAGVFGYAAVAQPSEITDGTSNTVMIVGSGQMANPWILGGGATIRGVREPIFDRASGLGTKGLPAPGTIAMMADGSVRYVPTTIDPKIFRAMCTIHGAETVDLDAAAAELPLESLK